MIGRRDPHVAGRHRIGHAPAAVHRRVWDGPARAEAERLERSWPGWVVLYGPGSRRFHALAAWPSPAPVKVCGRTPAELEEGMRQAEADALLRRHPFPSPGDSSPSVPAPRRPS
ncbi:hypothetical protein GCM10017673_47700 [Streptosporangium violaceochromogenes]|nr:hypothetical protein GCM10017673_47700 [Streptosporangium violaceochromogenes]